MLIVENAIDFLIAAKKVNAESLINDTLNFISKNLKLFLDTQQWNDVIAPDPNILNTILKKHVSKIQK